jgi:hypothetical protein
VPTEVAVSCENDDRMVGGGYSSLVVLPILSSRPVGEDSWEVIVLNETAEDREFTVYVRCLKTSPGQQGK